MIADKEKIEIYEGFIDDLYMYSTISLLDSGVVDLLRNAAALSRSRGQYDETKQARDLIERRTRCLRDID